MFRRNLRAGFRSPVSFGERAFWRNGALSRPTAGVTFANRLEFFDWLILDRPLHSNANRYILFLHDRTLNFPGPELLPPNWFSPENLPGGAGDTTQKTNLVQTCWSECVVRKMGRPGKFAQRYRWCDPKSGHPSGRVSEKNFI